MEIIIAIGTFLKIAMFFLDLWKEKDKLKAEKKAAIGKEIVNALKQTDKKVRASMLNVAVSHIHTM